MNDFLSKFISKIDNMHKIITAIPTLFDLEQKIDFKSMEKLINFQIKNGIEIIVVGGSTGELLLLETNEYLKLLNFIQQKYGSKITIIGCCTSASTDHSLALAKAIKNIGINYVLCATPFYVKPSQDGIFNHFQKISEIIDTIIYSVPSRTASDMEIETIKKLAHLDGVIGYKDANSNFGKIANLSKYIQDNNLNFKIFAGDDINYLGFSAYNVHGVISVVSNIFPHTMCKIARCIQKNDFAMALQKFNSILNFINLLNLETNPLVIKYLIAKFFNLDNFACREPLTLISDDVREKCDVLLKNSNNININ